MTCRAVPIYRVAGRRLATDISADILAPLATAATAAIQPAAAADLQQVYHGPGWVAGSWKQVVCSLGSDAYHIEVEGVGCFAVPLDGAWFTCQRTVSGVDRESLIQTALGPALILGLALQDVFCLHASAVRHRDSVAAFIGTSGAGKSTLARQLSADPSLPWARLADDILPVEVAAGCVTTHPHFPQLKLGPDAQPWCDQPEQVSLGALLVIQPGDDADQVTLTPMGPSDRALALLERTVAARLFAPELRVRHLGFCARTAELIPVYRLSYPWHAQHLAEVDQVLRAALKPVPTAGRC
jgi:hypothetical protein